jgi:hypothetical protein
MNNELRSGSFLPNGFLVLCVAPCKQWEPTHAIVLARQERVTANGKVQGEFATWIVEVATGEADSGHYFRPDQCREAAADFLDRSAPWQADFHTHRKAIEAGRKLATRGELTDTENAEANKAGDELNRSARPWPAAGQDWR